MKAFSRHSAHNAHNNIVVALFVITACLIVILRSLSPLLINSDSAIQIGTALKLSFQGIQYDKVWSQEPIHILAIQ